MAEANMGGSTRRYRRLKLVLSGGVLTLVIGVCLFGYVDHLRLAHQQTCKRNLKRLTWALQYYHDVHGSFPPAYTVSPDGQPLHSWRVLLLPMLDNEGLYDRFRLDEPWDSEHNLRIAESVPSVYQCPAHDAGIGASYVAVVGSGTVWPYRYSVALGDIQDGTSGTLLLTESHNCGMRSWTEPIDLSYEQALRGINSSEPALEPGISSKHRDGAHLAFCDGSAHFAANGLDHAILKASLTKGGPPPAGAMLPFEQVGGFRPLMPYTEFPDTDVLPYLAASIRPGRNNLYCSTMQIAFDLSAAKPPPPADVAAKNPQIVWPMALAMSRETFDPANLDPTSYVAEFVSTREEAAALSARMEQFLPNSGIDVRIKDGPSAYALLAKVLPFATKFERFEEPLVFHTAAGEQQVASFGIFERASTALKRQLEIVDFTSPDDFVVQLRTRTDLITLAKVAPAKTLAATVDAVESRVAAPRRRSPVIEVGEVLQVPVLSFSIDRDYGDELNPPFYHARQFIRFLLNESGAILVSGGEVRAISEPKPVFMGTRMMIFDKPFLVMLHEPEATQPYLVMWIENVELLAPFTS